MRLIAVKTRVVKSGDDLVELVLKSLKAQGLQLEEGDVLALTSKVVSFSEGRIVKLSDVKPSEEANRLAKEYSLKAEFAELILREADRICGGVEKAVLTLKSGVLAANAGIDNKNTPSDYAVLWPKNPEASARKVRDRIKRRTGKNVAVMIVDSGLAPLRIGTTGLALAVAGFKPIRDNRGSKDLFGKPILITRQAVADDLASAAHLLMGEATERTPVVLIKEAPVDFDDGIYGSADMMMPSNECIFMGALDKHLVAKRKARA
jgi:coenzyme F420-0:L-glutamate ligase